jgi:cytochrome bd-type quinol oxidase subunit 2
MDATPDRPKTVVAEPRLVLLALVAVSVLMLCILAIFETDDVWIVLLTVVSIALIAAAIGIDVWRIMARAGDDDASDGGDAPGA